MSALDVFQYAGQEVRTVTIDGEPWFVLADLCAVLGLEQVSRVKARLDDALTRSNPIEDRSGRSQMTNLVSEPGMYEVVIRSDKPEAAAFRRWITGTVLPTIRKTGAYGSAPALTEDQIVQQALTILVAKTTALESKVAELEPSATAWDELASATGDYEVADAAKILARAGVETGRQRLFTQLHDLSWIYRASSGKWKARQAAVDAGYLAEKPMSHHHPRTGELVLDPPQVRVTVRGIERLRVRLGSIDLAVAS